MKKTKLALQTVTVVTNLEVLPPTVARDQQIAEDITSAYADAQRKKGEAVRGALVCGLLLEEKKGECKHGEFGPWLEKNCPDVPWRTATHWMKLASGVCDFLQIGNDCQFDGMKLPALLQLPPETLSKKAQEVQQKFFAVVDNKTQKEVMFQLRDAEPEKKTHTPKKQTAKQIAEAEKKLATEMVQSLISTMDTLRMEGKLLGLIDDSLFETLENARVELGNYMKQIKKGRKA